MRAAIDLGERIVQARKRLDRAQDRPGDEVRDADFRAGMVARAVEDVAVLLECAHRNRAYRCGCGDQEAQLHVLHEAQQTAANGLRDVAGHQRWQGQCAAGTTRDQGCGLVLWLREGHGIGAWLRGSSRDSADDELRLVVRCVVLFLVRHRRGAHESVEVVAPTALHGPPIGAIPLEDVKDKGVVGAEVGGQALEDGV